MKEGDNSRVSGKGVGSVFCLAFVVALRFCEIGRLPLRLWPRLFSFFFLWQAASASVLLLRYPGLTFRMFEYSCLLGTVGMYPGQSSRKRFTLLVSRPLWLPCTHTVVIFSDRGADCLVWQHCNNNGIIATHRWGAFASSSLPTASPLSLPK